MILEVADIQIAIEQATAFEKAVHDGVAATISQAKGYLRHELRHSIESPNRYLLLIHWATLEDHTVDFRGSPAFAKWREFVGTYFHKPPLVEHFSVAAPV